MLKVRCKIFTAVFILLFISSGITFSQDKVKNVVIFFALSSNLPSYQNFIEGFNAAFQSGEDEPINLIIEYLDLGRAENEIYARHIIDIYNTKFRNNSIDLLITFGPGIYPVLEKYDLKVLKTSPVINIDLDTPGRASSQTPANVNNIEMIIKLRSANTLRAAFDLFPKYTNVFVISGISATDRYFTHSIEDCIKEFEPIHNFTFVTGLTIDSTIQYAKKIPANSIVIIPTYLLDENNIPYSTPEAINTISRLCKAPIFPVTDSFTKKGGGIGGNILSFVYLGKEAGRIAIEMLNGKRASEIKLNENSYYRYIYDWQQLKKWGLVNSRLISKESIFYNKETSFFSEYHWYICGFMVFLFSQTLLILYLIKLNKRQKLITGQMLETETIHREMIREDRLAKMVELTASLSHELNQPLSAILFSAQAGKRFLQTGKLNHPQAEEIFDNIIEDDKRAGEIISSVKSLMKLESRGKENINLNSLIHETINIIHTEAISQRVKIELKLENAPVFVFCDKTQIQQVLMNFIRNAFQSMEKNDYGNRILEIVQQQEKGTVMVSVRDSGPGIDESILKSLFKPFVTTNKKGFGIGLALSRSIIEKHQGEIWANNLVGGGAEFSFRLHISG
jgi:signal transduction histidine kinase